MGIFGGGNSHKSNIAGLGEMFDPMSWILPDEINPHTYAKPIANWSNEALSKVAKPINQFHTAITPGKQWIDDNVGIAKAWNQTVENRPVDALAVAAATFFSGGAAAGAGAGGAGATGAGLGTAGNAAANAALAGGSATGAGAATGAGLGTLGSAGTAYGSAMLGGAGSAGAAGAATAAGGGLGGLGAAGTTAGLAALTPTFTSAGTAALTNAGMSGVQPAGSDSYFGQMLDKGREYYDQFKVYKDYYDQARTVYDSVMPQQQQLDNYQQQGLDQSGIYDPNTRFNYDAARYLRGY